MTVEMRDPQTERIMDRLTELEEQVVELNGQVFPGRTPRPLVKEFFAKPRGDGGWIGVSDDAARQYVALGVPVEWRWVTAREPLTWMPKAVE